MKEYRVEFRFQHRKWGPQREAATVKASNICAAASRSLKEFLERLEPKTRRDVRSEVTIQLRRLKG